MRIYIDTENVEETWVEALRVLNPSDVVHVFFTGNSKNIRIQDIDLIKEHQGTLETIPVGKGPNALDFQLASLLGYHVAKGEDHHIILSGDHGFYPLEEFWKEEAKVVVVESLEALIRYMETGKVPERCKKSSGRIVTDALSDDFERRKVQSILDKTENFELSEVYTKLIGEFGEDKGLKIYRSVKPHLKK